MTEHDLNTEPEPEALDPEEPEEPTEDTEPEEPEDDALAKVRKEAAGYRTRLREAEAQRDELATRLESFQAQAAVKAATGPGMLRDGEDLFRAGVNVSELIADDGTLDHDKLTAAVAEVRERHPHWGEARPAPRRPAEPFATGTGMTRPEPGWHDVLNPR
jgi:hypothetical protein